ncbi:hypothetical protein B296_00045619 [Ensete ventricosum]|uniref:Uncharacterized protein n=1 Tax=Ensete ventricosum TaxID=4639 RepID=A0A426Y0R9_ENSVE|nr:hypothetical protein B296_00045619 [Ensete ventricosum]
MHRARVRTILLGTLQECVAEGIGSLPGWRKEVRQKKTETRRKIVGGWDSSDDAVGNSPRVRRELAEGIGSLPGRRKGVRRKKSETRRKIVEGSRKACRESNYDRAIEIQSDDGPRSSLGIGPGFRQCSGTSPGVRLMGTRREIVGRIPKDSRQEYRRLPDWRGRLNRQYRWVNRPYSDFSDTFDLSL